MNYYSDLIKPCNMKISYFQKNKNEKAKWDHITRDERFFCSELFHNLRSDQKGFLSLIKESLNLKKYDSKNITDQDKERLDFLKNIDTKEFDIGFEVCFYRDLLKLYGKGIKGTDLPPKRTFDLAFFSEEAIVIIEAKAQQSFDTKQLKDFKKDRDDIKLLSKIIGKKMPKVYIVGLHSSNYTPGTTTISVFDSTIQWDKIAEIYPDSKDLFCRANEIYPNKNSRKECN